MKTLGKKITDLRKKQGMTQDQLAEIMNVSSQAVSKWENDLSIPDIPVLIELSNYFHISLDELLKNDEPQVALVPEPIRKPIDQMILRILVNSAQGDKVKVQLPMALVKLATEVGLELPQVSGNTALKNLDLATVFRLVELGMVGRIVEVDSAEGDHVIIEVE